MLQSVRGIESAESALQQSVSGTDGTGIWDGEQRVISKHADSLLQLDNGVKVRSAWHSIV